MSESDQQHVHFMIYRRRVVEAWPESALKTVILAAIDASIASLSRSEAESSAVMISTQPETDATGAGRAA